MTKARDLANAADVLDDVSATELSYVNGVTSAIQTQLNAKQAVVSGVNDTEIGYLDGVTSAIQTQLDAKTAKSTLSTTGDIYYASSANTPARLGIGSSGQVLTVASGIPSWAAASSGAVTKIVSGTFTSQATVDVDNCFTSTYKVYMIVLGVYNSVSQEDLLMQYRYAGPSTQTTDYYGSYFWYGRGVGTVDYSFTNTNGNLIDPRMDTTTEAPCTIYINRVGNSSQKPFAYSTGFSAGGSQAWTGFSGYNDTAQTYTGFRLLSTSGNITGRYAVYGLEN